MSSFTIVQRGSALAALLAVACTKTDTPLPDAGPPDSGLDLAGARCRFAAGDSSRLDSGLMLIAEVSERLSAPAGGLWWIARGPGEDGALVAQSDAGPVTLEAVDRALSYLNQVRGAALRVPAALAPGTRLRLGSRVLTVEAPQPKLRLDDVVVTFAYRPELGGTGFSVRIPPAKRARVMVTEGYVGPAGANVYLTTQVLAGLSLADAPRLCDVAVAPDADELFVPMWAGPIAAGSALGLSVSDADDLANGFHGRICEMPGPSSNCLAQLPGPAP